MPTVTQQQLIPLPEPRLRSKVSLERALAERRSKRAYASAPVELAEAGQLLWAAQGITGPEEQRTAPSAGALYPLELYLSATKVDGLAPGLYRYHPEAHELALHAAGDRRRDLTAAADDQDCVRFSACVILLAAATERTAVKYGQRAAKFICLEAGHAAENACLQATALGLGVCEVGAFDPEAVKGLFHLPAEEEAIYMLTVGRPIR